MTAIELCRHVDPRCLLPLISAEKLGSSSFLLRGDPLDFGSFHSFVRYVCTFSELEETVAATTGGSAIFWSQVDPGGS